MTDLDASWRELASRRNPLGWFGAWQWLYRQLSEMLGSAIMGILFFAVLTPAAVVMRWAGKDLLRLRFEPETGGFAVWAYDTHKLPICPLHYHRVLGDEHPELERLGDAFSGLPDWRPRIAQRAKDLQSELGTLARRRSDVREAVQVAVERINGEPGRLETWRQLDALIEDQNWRAAHFRVAADDINYRRFFDINELAGLRMELPELFDHAHRLIFELLRNGVLDGLRIDHVDGLFDPRGYLMRLREHAPRPFYLVVEKILARHEALREDWPVEGTTGYEFANLVLGLLVDPSGEDGFTQTYTAFTGEHRAFDDRHNADGGRDAALHEGLSGDGEQQRAGKNSREMRHPAFTHAPIQDERVRHECCIKRRRETQHLRPFLPGKLPLCR